MSNIFWLNDPSILYSDGNYKNIIPTNNMTQIQKLNAITCLCIYLFLVLLLLSATSFIVIPILIIIIIVLYFYGWYNETNLKTKEHMMEREYNVNVPLKKKYKRHKSLQSKIHDQLYNFIDSAAENNDENVVASNSDDLDINKKTINDFDKNLYMDVNDLFNLNLSQRMWYMIPKNLPDTIGLGSWLWQDSANCKKNQGECTK